MRCHVRGSDCLWSLREGSRGYAEHSSVVRIICNEFEWESKANFCFGLIFAQEQLRDINYYILVCIIKIKPV